MTDNSTELSAFGTLYYGEDSQNSLASKWIINGLKSLNTPRFNFEQRPVKQRIVDLRQVYFTPKIDVNGFEKINLNSSVEQNMLFKQYPTAIEEYKNELKSILYGFTDAADVQIFDVTIRAGVLGSLKSSHLSANQRVHVDQNPQSAYERALTHGFSNQKFSRFQILNVWRPLLFPVKNLHLGFCDYQSLLPDRDLVPTELIFPKWLKDKENFSLKFHANHQWYFWSALAPNEAVIFKCYDSLCQDLVPFSKVAPKITNVDIAGLCPHSAFLDEKGPQIGKLRQSVELRALIFYR